MFYTAVSASVSLNDYKAAVRNGKRLSFTTAVLICHIATDCCRTAARFDCASHYFLHVTLESDAGRILDVFDSERFVGQWEDQSWIKVCTRCSLSR